MELKRFAVDAAEKLEEAVLGAEEAGIIASNKKEQGELKQRHAIKSFLAFYDGLDNIFGFPFVVDAVVKAVLPYLVNYVHSYLISKEEGNK